MVSTTRYHLIDIFTPKSGVKIQIQNLILFNIFFINLNSSCKMDYFPEFPEIREQVDPKKFLANRDLRTLLKKTACNKKV